MASKEKILEYIDKAIAAMAVLAPIIPGKVDDALLSFLKWARNDDTILDWLDKFVPPAPGAFTAPPEVVVEAIRRWKDETGGNPQAATAGSYIGLIMLLLDFAAAFKKWRDMNNPAQPT